jgi:hypothetical protein
LAGGRLASPDVGEARIQSSKLICNLSEKKDFSPTFFLFREHKSKKVSRKDIL